MRYVDDIGRGELLGRDGRLEPARAPALVGQVAGALDTAQVHVEGVPCR